MRTVLAILILAGCGGEELDVPALYEDPELVCFRVEDQLLGACTLSRRDDLGWGRCECPRVSCDGWTECDPFAVAECYQMLEMRMRHALSGDVCPSDIPVVCLDACF